MINITTSPNNKVEDLMTDTNQWTQKENAMVPYYTTMNNILRKNSIYISTIASWKKNSITAETTCSVTLTASQGRPLSSSPQCRTNITFVLLRVYTFDLWAFYSLYAQLTALSLDARNQKGKRK